MALKTLFERRAQQTVTQATPEQQPGLPENALKNNEVTRATPVTQSFEISEADAGSSPAGPEKGVARPLLCRVTGVTWVTTLKDKERSGNPAVTQAGTWVTGSAQRQPAPVSAGSLAARLAAAGATVRVWDGGDQSHVELPAGISADLLHEVEARGWRIIPGGRANPEAVHDSWLAGVPISELER